MKLIEILGALVFTFIIFCGSCKLLSIFLRGLQKNHCQTKEKETENE